MREREKIDINTPASKKFNKLIFPAAVLALTIAATACGGDDEGDKGQDTATPFRTRVERTFTPTASPTEEATAIITALPTLEPTPEPTAIYYPPVVTPKPTLRQTLAPTPVPNPTATPLEVCNTGMLTNPVDGQTVTSTVNVKALLAHNGDYSKGCSTDSAPNYISVNAAVIDSEGRRYPWQLYCGFVYPDTYLKEWECFRNGVILADDPSGNDLELTINDTVVDGVELSN